MEKLLKNTTIVVTALVLLCGYIFFFQLGKLALTDPDETFYAQTAKEMTLRNEWITPYLYGKPQFEKPILFYWLVEASFKAFGVNEFSARLPSAIFGTIGVIAVFFLGSLLFNRTAGFLSALILATNIEYVILSRACITDMVLFVLLLLSALFFLCGYIKKKGYFYLLSSLTIALVTLTKGPIYPALFGFAAILSLLLAGDLKALKRVPWWQSALIFIAVAAPWYAAIYKLHGKAFIDGFFGFHNVNRFLVSEHKIGSQFYYNIPVMFGGMFPWSVFLPVGFWHIFRKIRSRRRGGSGEGKAGPIFLLAWFAVIFGFFTISSTKLPTYIFPCFISLAVIAGVLLADFAGGGTSTSVAKGVRISFYLLIFIMLFGWIGGAAYAKADFPSITRGVIISGLFIAFGAILSLAAFRAGKFIAAFMLIAYAMILFLYPVSVFLLPDIERYETSKEIAEKLIVYMKPGEKLGCESNHLAGLAYYTGIFPADIDRHHHMVQLLGSKERVWAVMKEKNHKQLYDPVINKDYVEPSYMVYKIGKRAIVTNRMPSGGEYILKRERP
ncbi:MAG: glycosyltransferase family 39 protein [Candidatus Omnitrophica bacterium]|nr:glycosyltransferase family 39 protein [Candidatus Omnitrophota bacterium]